MDSSQISLNQVSFAYEKGQNILKNISFHTDAHDSIGLVGANGAGKSTLLKLLVGLNLNFTGEIRVGDLPVKKETLPNRRENVGYVCPASESQLFMSTGYEDVAFAPRNYGLPEDEVEQRVSHALELVGITHLKDKQIYKMSGGEKKLASIATILSMTPDIILMDEPSIALDPRNRRNLIGILNSFDQLKIIASHDLDMILDTCKRTILIDNGEIICDGNTRDILSDQKLLESHGLELPLCMGHSCQNL
ncbi:MAG: energy-coupling factor ABC transporter ATP-binding protein [Lachnospiraceae bacterium]|nr:energy-coupling factor ABC transporter ATP-binding protein [Lachnospiraceae bacterium]